MKRKISKFMLIVAAVMLLPGSITYARSHHHTRKSACTKRQGRCQRSGKHKAVKYCKKTAHHGRIKAKKYQRAQDYYSHHKSHSHH